MSPVKDPATTEKAMATDIDSLVQKIHSTPTMASITTTGGGTSIFPWLLEIGGGSKTLVGGSIPYDPAEHEEFLGGKSDRWVAEADARALAMKSYLNAQRKKRGVFIIGVGATSSLMRVERDAEGNILPERPGRKHSIYLALQTPERTVSHTLVYDNTALPESFAVLGNDPGPLAVRRHEEHLTAWMLLNLLAEGCNLEDRVRTGVEDLIVRREARAEEIHPDLPKVLFGGKQYVSVTCGQNLTTPLPNYCPPLGLVPGSYNPIHVGHRKMRQEVLDHLKLQDPDPVVGYEITIKNADKPPIDYLSLKERLAVIADDAEQAPVYLTSTTKFIDKARLFVGCTFGCGYDTAVRIVDPTYYGNDPDKRDVALAEMRDYGTRFIVFGRKSDETGEFLTLNDIDVPEFSRMSTMVHEVRFREDVRSRDIRNPKEGAL